MKEEDTKNKQEIYLLKKTNEELQYQKEMEQTKMENF